MTRDLLINILAPPAETMTAEKPTLRDDLRAQLTEAISSSGRSADSIAGEIWGPEERRAGGERIRYAVRKGWPSAELLDELAAHLGLRVEIRLTPNDL